MEYFAEKLSQYGEGTEVPIRSLLGHRSQASPEVRHVSGQHFHEFREFLGKHPDAFTVDDEKETVVLANYTAVRSNCPPELHFQPDVKIDPEETQTLLDFMAQCIELKGPILVEQLFQVVSCNLPESMWSNLLNTANHLTSFLRLFSDSFHIQSNLVTLLQPPKISQKHINTQVNLIKESPIKTPPNEVEVKNVKNLSEAQVIEEPEKVFPTVDKSPTNAPIRSINDRLKRPKMIQKAEPKSLSPEPQSISPTLEEKATENNRVFLGVFKLGQTGKTCSTEESPPVAVDSRQVKQASSNQTLKQRINNLVLKTLQENTGRERQNLLNHQQYNDTWKIKLFQNTRVICSTRECQLVVEEIMSRKRRGTVQGKDESWPFGEEKIVIGFDCEGINLGVKGQLTLMQIATMDGFSYVFDLISCPQMIDAGLRKILESTEIVKVKKSPTSFIILAFYCSFYFLDYPRLPQRFRQFVPTIQHKFALCIRYTGSTRCSYVPGHRSTGLQSEKCRFERAMRMLRCAIEPDQGSIEEYLQT